MTRLDFSKKPPKSKLPLREMAICGSLLVAFGVAASAGSWTIQQFESHIIDWALRTDNRAFAEKYINLYGAEPEKDDGAAMEDAYRKGWWQLVEKDRDGALSDADARIENFLTLAIERQLGADVDMLLGQLEGRPVPENMLYLAIYAYPSEHIALSILRHGVVFDEEHARHSNQVNEALDKGWDDFAVQYVTQHGAQLDQNDMVLRYRLETYRNAALTELTQSLYVGPSPFRVRDGALGPR